MRQNGIKRIEMKGVLEGPAGEILKNEFYSKTTRKRVHIKVTEPAARNLRLELP